ncbi:hypothetical protein ASD89_13590 [Caulobacter sp. Root656]|nr:hypothetical protein ASD89_13590 [Caulobacter sp. Root656]
MAQKPDMSGLVKSKAFWLALVFNWACLGVALFAFLTWNQTAVFFAMVILGGLPVMAVTLRHAAQAKADAAASSNPKIVE